MEIHALVTGLEPLDEDAADRDLWAILQWVTAGVDGEWSADALATTGQIYGTPGAMGSGPDEAPAPEPVGELFAFDLYGTLVDPLAMSIELASVVGPDDAERAATTCGERRSTTRSG